jgi:hypothetical protein
VTRADIEKLRHNISAALDGLAEAARVDTDPGGDLWRAKFAEVWRQIDEYAAALSAEAAPAAAQPPPDLAPLVLDGASALEEAAERWGEVNPDALAAKARDLRAALAGAAQPRPKTYAEQFQADLAADRAAAQPQAEGAPDPDDWPTCSRCGVVLVCDGTRHTTAALAAEREAGRREGYELGWRDRGNAAPRPETPPADKERT